MKKLTVSIVVIFVLAIGSMLGIHWKQLQDMEVGWDYKDRQTERREIAQSLVLELEQYRASSAGFRRIPESAVLAAKERIRNELGQGISALEKLAGETQEERSTVDLLRNQFNEFLVMAAKLEPMYYSRNVYQNPEMQSLHDAIKANLGVISEEAKALSQTALQQVGTSERRSLTMLIAAALLASTMLALVLLNTYFRLTRPLAEMQERIRLIRKKGARAPAGKALPAAYGEAERAVRELASSLEMHQQDKQRFINAIVTDLRPALTALQASANALLATSEHASAESRMHVQELSRRALFRVSGVLEDLTDLLDEDLSRIRLSERIVDLGDLLSKVSNLMGGHGSQHPVHVSVPKLPVWATVDPQRFERIIINLISKQMLFQPQGGRIHLSMSDPSQGASDGIEISIYASEENTLTSGDDAPSGPEQDLIRHWASQSGFGVSLAYKIARAHGGTILAAGVAGMRVLFTLKLPKERIASGFLGTGAQSRLLT